MQQDINLMHVCVHIVKITNFQTKNEGKTWRLVDYFVNLQARNSIKGNLMWKHPLSHQKALTYTYSDFYKQPITTKTSSHY